MVGVAIVGPGNLQHLPRRRQLPGQDAYEKHAASALSATSLGRNTFGAFLPLAIQSLFRDLGFQWADRLLGFVRLALSAAPLVILWKGEEIRRRSLLMCKATFVTQEEEWGKSLLGA